MTKKLYSIEPKAIKGSFSEVISPGWTIKQNIFFALLEESGTYFLNTNRTWGGGCTVEAGLIRRIFFLKLFGQYCTTKLEGGRGKGLSGRTTKNRTFCGFTNQGRELTHGFFIGWLISIPCARVKWKRNLLDFISGQKIFALTFEEIFLFFSWILSNNIFKCSNMHNFIVDFISAW